MNEPHTHSLLAMRLVTEKLGIGMYRVARILKICWSKVLALPFSLHFNVNVTGSCSLISIRTENAQD